VFVEELSALSIKQPSEITPELPAQGSDGRKVSMGPKQLGEITPEPATPCTQVLLIAPAWTQVFIDYIKENKLPEDKEEATRVVRRCKNCPGRR
jgi:hypothetical protein